MGESVAMKRSMRSTSQVCLASSRPRPFVRQYGGAKASSLTIASGSAMPCRDFGPIVLGGAALLLPERLKALPQLLESYTSSMQGSHNFCLSDLSAASRYCLKTLAKPHVTTTDHGS